MTDSRARTIVARGLPGLDASSPSTSSQTYRFELGQPSCLPGETRVALHIPEHPHRDAEGAPQRPEQAAWIRTMASRHGLAMKEVWHSRWVFEREGDVARFVALLEPWIVG